jgi:hypothetical protein
MEASETSGTTALVYLQLHSSLYTGTVHVLSSVAGVHPTGLTADQGCRQVSTHLCIFEESRRCCGVVITVGTAARS